MNNDHDPIFACPAWIRQRDQERALEREKTGGAVNAIEPPVETISYKPPTDDELRARLAKARARVGRLRGQR